MKDSFLKMYMSNCRNNLSRYIPQVQNHDIGKISSCTTADVTLKVCILNQLEIIEQAFIGREKLLIDLGDNGLLIIINYLLDVGLLRKY